MEVYVIRKTPFSIQKYFDVLYIEDTVYLNENCFAVRFQSSVAASTVYLPKSQYEIMIGD